MLDTHDAIILACAAQPGGLIAEAMTRTGLSRVAVSRRLRKLVVSGHLAQHGQGTRQTYSLGAARFWLDRSTPHAIQALGGEMAVWERHLAPLLSDVAPNVRNLANIAFTEMLNNALDHAQAEHIVMGLNVDKGRLQMVVADDGAGIFAHVAEAAHLFDTRLAILELAKGKYTTAPAGHSGMGIFVTARMMDGYAIESRDLRFDPHEVSRPLPAFDWIDVPAQFKPGIPATVVRMDVALDSTRNANDVYLRYFEPTEVGAEAFHTTEVPVRLAQLSSQLVSRSQAKWVMDRATQFRTVVLDFEGVALVGQAFVDEVFRVFATAHPEVQLKTTGMSTDVARLVQAFSPR